MTVTIEKDVRGKDVIWSEVGEKKQKVSLEVQDLYLRLADGRVFTISSYRAASVLEPLQPHQVAMVRFWMDQHPDGITPNIFAGVSPPAKPEAEEDEPASDG